MDLFLFRLRYEAAYNELVASMTVLENAVHSLRSSTSLHRVFELLLAFGNYLNGGSSKGGAFAFHLETLTKLKNTKSMHAFIR